LDINRFFAGSNMIKSKESMETEVRPGMRGGTGTVTVQHFFKPEEMTARTRLCARLTLPPGASIGTHQHEHEDEVYMILSGEGVLDDGHTKTTVRAGDAVLTGKGESHAIANTGKDVLEIIAVIMLY
jgi:mannose-6-phosphate isomerase-like protein (cupin superfamily)